MKKENFIAASQAAFGKNFVTEMSTRLDVTDRTIRHWVSGRNALPESIQDEVVEILKLRKKEIEEAISMFELNIYTDNQKISGAEANHIIKKHGFYGIIRNGSEITLEKDFVIFDDDEEVIISANRAMVELKQPEEKLTICLNFPSAKATSEIDKDYEAVWSIKA